LKVEFKENSEIITISMSGSNPQELNTLVNAVMKAYVSDVDNAEKKKRTDRVRELENLYHNSREKLRISRDTWLRVANQLGSSDTKALSQKELLLIGTYSKLKDQHLHIAYDLKKAQTRLAALESRPAPSDEPLPETALTQALLQDPIATQYRTRMVQLEQILADYDRNAVRKRQETGAKLAEKDLESTRAALEARKADLHRQLTEQFRKEAQAQAQAEVATLRNDMGPLADQEKWLGQEVERLEIEVSKIGNTHTELDMLREDIKHDEQLTEKIGHQLDSARLELNSPMRVTPQQEAGIQKLDKKRLLVVFALAPAAAFACVAMGIVWWDTRSRRIQSVQEVVTGLGMRVMGAVPALPDGARRGMVETVDQPEAYGPNFLESIDAVRTLLLRDARLDGSKVVMVTSAVEGEGKTTLTSHLATSLARAGRRTLLIDCDLRRPTMQDLFELTLTPGFSECLRGQATAPEAVQQTSVDNLFVLTAGHWDREVMQTLAQEGAEKLLDQLRPAYDFIVIDSHPVLAATDSLLIGQKADAVILSLLRDRSQAHVVHAACQRLSSLGIRILGAVVNGIESNKLYESGYSYGVPTNR
jgi:capsular exopolysaccharide synthesis family protein